MVPANRFHIIGAGKVAHTFSCLWQRAGLQLDSVYSRRHTSAQALASLYPPARACRHPDELPPADIIAITCSDDALSDMAHALADLPWLTAHTLALHFSGACDSDILHPISARGAQTGSLHPVFAFAQIDTAIQQLPGHHSAIEGSPQALSRLRQLAQAAGLQPFVLPSAAKTRYHAALSLSANFLVTLHATAQNWLQQAGLAPDTAQQLVQQLMQQNLNQLSAMPPAQALTGPIVRGDVRTVAAHLQALSPDEQNLYRILAEHTLQLAAPRLAPDTRQTLQQLLAGSLDKAETST